MRNKRVIEQWIEKKDGTGFEIVQADDRSDDLVSLPGPDHLPARPERVQLVLAGSYSDRAKGFTIATWQLSAVVAVAAVVVSKLLFAYPLLSVVALAWFVSGFLVVWLIAYLVHTFVSAEGAEFIETWRHWDYIEREQRERLRRTGAPSPDSARGGSVIQNMLIAFFLVAGGLLLLMLIGGLQ